MNFRIAFVFAAFGLVASADNNDEPKLWALLVAGSNTWGNYRHQADVCHAYQILHAHGIPDENIIVMMYDDLADNKRNPTPGIVINHRGGDDVYDGVLKDYTKKDVTPDNFVNILTGNKEAMKGIGSGRVIESGPNDHVFVNLVDHGGPGIFAFPEGELTVKQLNDAILQLYNNKGYAKLVVYMEACESGSMFNKVLPNNISAYATTASSPHEASYACYYDKTRKTYLGDWYSVNWMEDSDAEDIEKETLDKQYQVVKNETTTSHVQEYGDLTVGGLDVGQFQGEEEPATPAKVLPKEKFERGAPSYEVPIDLIYRQLASATTEQEKTSLRREMDQIIQKRGYLQTVVKKIVSRVAVSFEQEERLMANGQQPLTNLGCHHNLVKAFSRNCFDFGKNTYALRYAYILANMCEQGLNADNIIGVMQDVCKSVAIKEGIE